MQNSGISSREDRSTPPSYEGSARKRFALSGRSAPIDPRIDAVRKDLADIRLADRVFAPHYASPMPRAVVTATELRESPTGAVIAQLNPGDIFEVLELAGANAWGVSPKAGLVGYLDIAALEEAGAA